MANGRVTTGFSKPYVALYDATGGEVSYTSGQYLARGVEVSIDAGDAGDNKFYADNITAELASSVFTSGTVTLTVDGLKEEASKLILGLPAAEDGWTKYGISQAIPFVGVGFVVRMQEEGVVSYVPMILRKCKFAQPGTNAATQEEDIDWQTQELSAQILRDDTAASDWKWVGEAKTSEADAEAAIQAVLGGDAPGPVDP